MRSYENKLWPDETCVLFRRICTYSASSEVSKVREIEGSGIVFNALNYRQEAY